MVSQARTGSIPACAGEPWGSSGRYRIGRVYPRVCGGTRKLCAAAVKPHGLSPRVETFEQLGGVVV